MIDGTTLKHKHYIKVTNQDVFMVNNASGKHKREGISLKKLMDMFPDDETACVWFEKQIWLDGPVCPHCGSSNA
ncbi:MAG: transposase [Aestuariivita sp.]|nr:transposase [Aestuariivita sp.]